jgi:hypothetical protein
MTSPAEFILNLNVHHIRIDVVGVEDPGTDCGCGCA